MITIIVAYDENLLIGKDNTIPWHISEELRHFKKTTLNGIVVMGRRTWDSLPKKPLPDRINCVISRTMEGDFRSLEEVIETYPNKEIFIIGGRQIYELAIPIADRILVSKIKGKYEGNVFFPELADWTGYLVDKKDEFDVFEYVKVYNFKNKPKIDDYYVKVSDLYDDIGDCVHAKSPVYGEEWCFYYEIEDGLKVLDKDGVKNGRIS